MATASPPNPNVNQFNITYWGSASSGQGLTQEQADLLYLKFPVSQSQTETILGDMDILGLLSTTDIINSGSLETDDLTVNNTFSIGTVDINNLTVNNTANSNGIDNTGLIETDTLTVLNATNLNGITNIGLIETDTLLVNSTSTFDDNTTFNKDIIQPSNLYKISQTDLTTNTNNNILRKTDIYGDLQIRRPTTENGGGIRIWDVANSLSGYSGQIYDSGTDFQINNLNNNGSLKIGTKDNTDILTNALTINSTNISLANPTIFTSTTAPSSSQTLLSNTESSAYIGTTQWVQNAIAYAISQIPAPTPSLMTSYINAKYDILSGLTKRTSFVLNYGLSGAQNFSITLEVSYTIYSNGANSPSGVIQNTLNNTSTPASPNPNFYAIINLEKSSGLTDATIKTVSTNNNNYNQSIIYQPTNQGGLSFSYIPFNIVQVNNGQSQISFEVPNNSYLTTNYIGNLSSVNFSCRIINSAILNDTNGKTYSNNDAGSAYFDTVV